MQGQLDGEFDTSVIIPAYGHSPHLPDLVRQLLGGDEVPGEIIVS